MRLDWKEKFSNKTEDDYLIQLDLTGPKKGSMDCVK
jgi:hypothetical protein